MNATPKIELSYAKSSYPQILPDEVILHTHYLGNLSKEQQAYFIRLCLNKLLDSFVALKTEDKDFFDDYGGCTS